MSLLLFALLVVVVLILVLWAVSFMPLPPDAHPLTKRFIYALLTLIAAVVIAHRAGLFAAL